MHAPHESPPLFDNGGAYLPAVIVADLSAVILADKPDKPDEGSCPLAYKMLCFSKIIKRGEGNG